MIKELRNEDELYEAPEGLHCIHIRNKKLNPTQIALVGIQNYDSNFIYQSNLTQLHQQCQEALISVGKQPNENCSLLHDQI